MMTYVNLFFSKIWKFSLMAYNKYVYLFLIKYLINFIFCMFGLAK